MTPVERAELLNAYRDGPSRLKESVAGASIAQLDDAPPELG